MKRRNTSRIKPYRQEYSRSKRFDYSCRCNGSCSYCRDGRLFNTKKRKEEAEQKEKDWLI